MCIRDAGDEDKVPHHRGGAAGEHVGVEQQPGHHPGPAKGPRGEGREGCLH